MTTTGQRITSQAAGIALADARERLVDLVLGAEVVPGRLGEEKGAERIVDRFIAGLGPDAETILSSFLDRAGARLVRTVVDEHRRFTAKPQYEEVVQVDTFAPVRFARPAVTRDRTGPFSRSTGYEGWKRSLYEQAWFDSSTERQLAALLDDAPEVRFWVRLQTGDLRILWQSDGREYNPDFVAVESEGTHWLVESKMNKEMASADVRGKENAAQRWANHVSSHPGVGTEWRYLLVSEDDIQTARGSWAALKKLGAG